MASEAERAKIFSRCNIPEELIKRFTSKSFSSGSIKSQATTDSKNSLSPEKAASIPKRNSAPTITVTGDSPGYHTQKNKVNLERFLLSVPLANDVANFSDTEGPRANRLPLYSDNYESESFCLPSSGYKSDSEGRGRSKYRIRTSHSANPSPEHSPERPARRASVRRTQSLKGAESDHRVFEIRQRLKNSQRQELLNNNNNKNNIHERLKQLGSRGLNTTSAGAKQTPEKTVYNTRNSLRSRSLNQIADTEKSSLKEERKSLTQDTNNNCNNTNGSNSSLLRSRSFNSLRNNESTKQPTNANQGKQLTSSSKKVTNQSTLQPSPTSAFDRVRQQFGNDKWKRRSTTTLGEKKENLRASSFSSLQDAWESRRAFDNNFVQKKTVPGNSNTNNTRTHTSIIHPNSISDAESFDIISRRRERRRIKREIYNQRNQSDKSDSETETEESHIQRHTLERLERRRANSNPRRSSSRNSRLSQQIDGNNSDSNDENNNECPSDKTLDSGVFDLALSNLSANISKLSKRYNSDEFLADCLSPKSGYSSATESLAESLAESTTTFYDSNDDHNEMDPRRKRPVNRSKLKTDKTNVKTAVLNSTRAKGTLNGMVGGSARQSVKKIVKKEVTGMTESTSNIQMENEVKQTKSNKTDIVQIKPQSNFNKRQSLTAINKPTTTPDPKSSTTNKTKVPSTSKESPIISVHPQKDKQILEKKISDKSPNKSNEGGEKNKAKKASIIRRSSSPSKSTSQKEKARRSTDSHVLTVRDNEKSSEKQQPPPTTPKKKIDNIETPSIKSEPTKHKVDGQSSEKKDDATETPKTSPVKKPKNGLLSKDRKISQHNCCGPKSDSDERSESPSQQKKVRRVSHQGCFSPTDIVSENGSRSNTPTKTRRVSHAGCFSPIDKATETDNSRSNTPTQKRRISHHNCFKPVNTSDNSDSSRSNTPTLSNSDVTSSTTTNNRVKSGERRISHHNCLDSPSGQQEQLRRHSLQHQNSTTLNSVERKMSNSNANYRIQIQSNSTNKAAIIVGPALIKDEIKPKLARECVSPPLSASSGTNHLQKHLSNSSEDELQSTQLSRIDENHTHDINTSRGTNKDNVINIQENGQLRADDNGISTLKSQRANDEQLNENTDQRQRNFEKQTNGESMAQHKKVQSLKFNIDKTTVESKSGKKSHRLIRQGESIELHLSLDEDSSTKTVQISSSGQTGKSVPLVAPKPTSKKPTQNNNKENSESLDKAVQCLILTHEKESTQLNGNKVINVCDISREITINEDIVQQLGSDILDGIHFTYPDYFITAEQKDKIEKDLLETEKLESELSDEEGLDVTDSAGTNNKAQVRYQQVKHKSFKLKMENTRLQQLLYEVEKARAGTMKALLHVNTVLNKVQGENTQLESELQVTGKENKTLKADVNDYQEKERNNIDNTGGRKGDRSLSIFVDQWKKEKKELLGQLKELKGKKEESEKATIRVQAQYKKTKEQLEHSNNAFTTTLQNNLEATKRMEEELKDSFDEKQEILRKMNESNKYKRELESLKAEMEELRAHNDELQDENDNLESKCKHLEKRKRQMQLEEEELHEQISHSQEIIEKLTDVEDELKERLHAEMKDKEYLQECLDETGHILYQLKNNENKLVQDREILIVDLEQEQEEKHSLQTTLNMTMDEHKEIVHRLQDMTNIHINVKESLQQATKNERNYQDQIEALTKTNHILHYTLEKEKEEKMDLQEMFDIIESDHKKFKNETVGKMKDTENKIDDLLFENHQLKEKKEEFEKKSEELQASLEHEEDANNSLTQKLDRLEKLKEAVDNELENLQDNSEEMEKSKTSLLKSCQELDVDLKLSKQKVDKLTAALEETEESFERTTKELTETKRRLEEYRNDYDDLQSKSRERMKKIRDLESSNEELTEQKDRYQNRMSFYENETRNLRKKVNEQTEEIGTLQIESQRFQRERDTYKRNCDMSVTDFEAHKAKCTETLKRLKDEILELSNKIIEKDRLAMKQKEHFQDQIENTQHDLKFLRSMLDGDIKRTIHGNCVRKNSEASDSGSEKLDLGILKNSHDKFRDEFQSHVNKLEDMLKHSNEVSDSVTVVQSPMSKIKLEELKQLRKDIFDVQADLGNIKSKYANVSAELTSVRLGTPSPARKYREQSSDERLDELEEELTKLDNLVTRIENRHKAVMTRSAVLLQRTLKEDDRTAKDLVKKFQAVSLESENKQLKTLLGILKNKYNFDESELASELTKANENNQNGSLSNGSLNNNNNDDDDFPSDDEPNTTRRISSRTSLRSDRTATRTQSTRRAQRNYSFFNEAVGSNDLSVSRSTYNRDFYQRSSGVSSYSSEDEDYTPTPRLPKRYNTLPSRARRPKP